MGLADLHIHTTYSFDGTSTVPAVLRKAQEIGLDVIAITDHDEIRGSLEAQDMASAYGLTVVPGSEVTTAEGHLLALFIQRRIPAGLSLEDSLRRVGEQGGLCIAPHPGGMRFNSLSPVTIRRALEKPDLAKVLVGIEVYNAGLFFLRGNVVAKEIANGLKIAKVGNSDAHMLRMIGRGATLFPGESCAAMRMALEDGMTWPVQGQQDSRWTLAAHWLSHYALRQLGWVSNSAGPESPLRLARET